MELTVGNLIKLILAILIIAAVGVGLYYLFSRNVSDAVGGLGLDTEMFLSLF